MGRRNQKIQSNVKLIKCIEFLIACKFHKGNDGKGALNKDTPTVRLRDSLFFHRKEITMTTKLDPASF
jgi:hypothetical protein